MELVHTEINRGKKCVIYDGYIHVQVHTDYLRWLYACTGTYRFVQVHTDYLTS
jgi:hypothetical protein